MNNVRKVLISGISLLLQRGLNQLISLPLSGNKAGSQPMRLFARSGKRIKSPSVILPMDLEHSHAPETTTIHEATHPVEHPSHETETHHDADHGSQGVDQVHHVTDLELVSTPTHSNNWGTDPIAESHGSDHPINHDLSTDKPSIEGSKSPLVSDDHKVEEHKVTEVKHEPEAKIAQEVKANVAIAAEHHEHHHEDHHHHHDHHSHHDHPDQSGKPEQSHEVKESKVEEVKPSDQVAAAKVEKETIDVVVTGAGGTKGGDAIAPPAPSTPPEAPVLQTQDIKPVVEPPAIAHGTTNLAIETVNYDLPPADHHVDIDPTPAKPDPVVVGHPEDIHTGEVDLIQHPETVIDPIISPVKHIDFTSGTFTVGAKGEVGVNYVFDGGAYRGDLAIFSLKDLDKYDINTAQGWHDFVLEVTNRALSNSENGHVIIADATEGARFSGILANESQDWNTGTYKGVETFNMRPGDTFGVMLVPNGTVQQLHDRPDAGGDIRPLFSMVTANPNEAFHLGQVADVNGKGNTFAMEDQRFDQGSDHDYNDVVFQFNGATSNNIVKMDEMVDPALDWRTSELGTKLMEFIKPPANQPLIGIIDTGISANNPNLNYFNIHFGADSDLVSGDGNPLLQPGEGSEHGTFITGVIENSQPHAANGTSVVVGVPDDGGIGDAPTVTSDIVDQENKLIAIEGSTPVIAEQSAAASSITEINAINANAPLYEIRAVGSGQWAQGLKDFVDAAKESGQPNAIANLSIDLTQINPDGSVTTRYEFTPFEREALEYARQNHVLIVVAAGNDGGTMSALGQSSLEFDNIISVGSGSINGRDAYSNYGVALDLLAEGGTSDKPELSTVGEGLGTMAGTSVAAAKATGVASQVWAANPDLSYRQVKDILLASATDIKSPGWDFETGMGLLNLPAALALAKATTPEIYAPTPLYSPGTWSGEGIAIPMERAVSNWATVITNGRRFYNGWLIDNDPDRSDTFTFSVGSPSPLQIGVGPEVRLTMTGNGINRTENFIRFGIDGEPLLPAGSYTIKVDKNFSGEVRYSLRLNFNRNGGGGDPIDREYDKLKAQNPPPGPPVPIPNPPLPPKPSRLSYTVRPGDTLWSIAARILGDGNRWKEISKDVDGKQFFSESEVRLSGHDPTLVFLPSGSVDSPLNTVPGNNASTSYYKTGALVQQANGSQSFYDKGNGNPISAIGSIIGNAISFVKNAITPKNVILKPGTTLKRGEARITSNGYKFVFQNDGNLVLTDPQNKPIWATGTDNKGADKFVVQADGNVVLYAGTKPLWATDTDNKNDPGAYLAIQGDGNLVVYSSSDKPLFSTGTDGGKVGTRTASQDWLNKRTSGGNYFSNLSSWRTWQSDPQANGLTSWEDQTNTIKSLNDRNSDIGKIYADLVGEIFGKDKYFEASGAYISDEYRSAAGVGYGYHGGIDIAAPYYIDPTDPTKNVLTPVRTIVSGKVVLADRSNYGELTIQDAQGINHIYMHLSEIKVNIDDIVTAGDVVGVTGKTGASAPHLHYEIARKDYPYGALQQTAAQSKKDFRDRTYNPLKNYWEMRQKVSDNSILNPSGQNQQGGNGNNVVTPTSKDIDTLARTLWGEARSENYSGMTAVAWVVKNRSSRSPSYGWPSNISDVCKQPWQFSCWNSNDPNYQKLLTVTDQDAAFKQCLEIARKVLNGELPDSSNGADHYYANYIGVPNWAVGMIPVAEIGVHKFYRLV